jgi:hypothetical protein
LGFSYGEFAVISDDNLWLFSLIRLGLTLWLALSFAFYFETLNPALRPFGEPSAELFGS